MNIGICTDASLLQLTDRPCLYQPTADRPCLYQPTAPACISRPPLPVGAGSVP